MLVSMSSHEKERKDQFGQRVRTWSSYEARKGKQTEAYILPYHVGKLR